MKPVRVKNTSVLPKWTVWPQGFTSGSFAALIVREGTVVISACWELNRQMCETLLVQSSICRA